MPPRLKALSASISNVPGSSSPLPRVIASLLYTIYRRDSLPAKRVGLRPNPCLTCSADSGGSLTSTQGRPMELDTLKELYIEGLKDLYSAENQILKALPRMI